MVTIDALLPGQSIPEPIVVEVTEVQWSSRKSRRAEIEVIDSAGNPLQLIDYEGANLSTQWERNRRYRISRCKVAEGGSEYELRLEPSKKTIIEPLEPTEDVVELLVIGDTHVGRDKHPKTGEDINPNNAFSRVVEEGINRGVDAVLHVGDIFHESATERDLQVVQQAVFSPLRNSEIPFYYIKGNHTSESGDELLTEVTNKNATPLDLTGTAVGTDVRLYGLNHYPMGDIQWSNVQFPATMDESTSILVLHQTLEQLSGKSPKSVDIERIQERASNRFDAILSGHHHDAICCLWKETLVMYTGASERMSKNEDSIDRVAWFLKIENGTVFFRRYDIPD